MAALDGDPGVALALLFFSAIVRVKTDGGGVDQQISTGQSHQARRFRVPLIPAHQHAEGADGGDNRRKTEITRGKVEFFVIARVIGDVHFAVATGDAAILFQYDSGIVVKSRPAFFKQRKHHNDSQFLSQSAKGVGAWSGDGFAQVEIAGIFGLAEIRAAMQFL